MNYMEIAKTVLNLSLDMDYMDTAEYVTDTVNEMAAGLEMLNNRFPSLYYALEIIAEQNESIRDFVSEMGAA